MWQPKCHITQILLRIWYLSMNLEYADFRFMGMSTESGKLPNGILSDGKRTWAFFSTLCHSQLGISMGLFFRDSCHSCQSRHSGVKLTEVLCTCTWIPQISPSPGVFKSFCFHIMLCVLLWLEENSSSHYIFTVLKKFCAHFSWLAKMLAYIKSVPNPWGKGQKIWEKCFNSATPLPLRWKTFRTKIKMF